MCVVFMMSVNIIKWLLVYNLNSFFENEGEKVFGFGVSVSLCLQCGGKGIGEA